MDYRDIEHDTLNNDYYRKVLYTNKNFQLVLMSLEPDEDIPKEKHTHTTQFIRVEKGQGIAQVGKKIYALRDGVSITIPPGKFHYVKNTGDTPLKLYSIYTPPEHPKKRLDKRQPVG